MSLFGSRKVPLLSLPAKFGSSSEVMESQTASDKFWYLQELFPDADESAIKEALASSSSLDEAEKSLLTLSCDIGMNFLFPPIDIWVIICY